MINYSQHLEERIGVTYRWVSRDVEWTGGVGGRCKIIGQVEVPLGVAGASGIKTMKTTEANIPPLLPGGFCADMGAVIDYGAKTVTWTKLKGRQRS